jgi:hypothetical protein
VNLKLSFVPVRAIFARADFHGRLVALLYPPLQVLEKFINRNLDPRGLTAPLGDVRSDVFAFMDKHDFKYIPSVSNKFMIDVGRPSGEFTLALQKKNVYIANRWPVWPTHVRVSIGAQDEMVKFKTAFLKVTNA